MTLEQPNSIEQYVTQSGQLTLEGVKFFQRIVGAVNTLDASVAIIDGTVSMSAVSAAEAVVLDTYGDTVSAATKAKSLLKFGRNDDLDTGTRETIWNNGGDETYVTTNAIDTISSSSASDTQVLQVEYHTVTGTGASAQYTFGLQDVALNGQSKVPLSVPGARTSRIRNNGDVPLVGNVYVYEDTAISGGVPTDVTKIHAEVLAGDDQSFKAATTFSNTDYAFITSVYGSVKRSTSAVVDFRLETRAPGGIFLPKLEFSAVQSGGVAQIILDPFIIVPKNYDVRITGQSNTNNTTADAGFNAILAAVTS